MLQVNFKIAHIAGSVNSSADFLYRLDLKVTQKIRLRIREDIQTIPLEVTTSSSDVADEKQFFFTQAENENESEQQILERNEQFRQKAKQCVANIKLIMIKKPTVQSSEKQSMFMSYRRIQIIKGKIPLTEFRWIGPNIIEKLLPNNNYPVRKIGTNKIQVLHRSRMRQIAPRQSIRDKGITPQEWKPDPEVSLKYDDLYSSAWECE